MAKVEIQIMVKVYNATIAGNQAIKVQCVGARVKAQEKVKVKATEKVKVTKDKKRSEQLVGR